MTFFIFSVLLPFNRISFDEFKRKLMDFNIIIQAFWIVIPIYVANASAVIVGGGKAIDFGKNFKDGHRILGDGKTWRGLFTGTFLGMTAGFGLVVAAKYLNTSEYPFLGVTDFEGFPIMILILFSLCFGALLGDQAIEIDPQYTAAYFNRANA